MPEVLDIRELGGEDPRPDPADAAVGEADRESEPSGGGGPPRWRRSAAIGVVVALFLTVAYMLTTGRPGAVGTASRAKVADTASPVERAARAALDAWAAFASSGDIEGLRATFDQAGPQRERLLGEAAGVKARVAPSVAYRFSATVLRSSAGRDQDEQLVAADVVVSRPGETDQRFVWELVMRRSDGRWRLWTVRDRAALDGVGAGGRP